MKAKPIVKYDDFTFEFCGETHQVKKKLTLLVAFNGKLAKKINDAQNKCGLRWTYDDDSKGKERLEFYKDETISDVIVKQDDSEAMKMEAK